MIEEKRTRINLGTFDFVKGIAIIVVVCTHMTYYYDATKLLPLLPAYAILKLMGNGTMPMFFMIIGFCFKKEPVIKTLKKAFHELIIPYVVVMIACAVLFPVMHYLTFRWWPGAIQETIRYVIAFLLGISKGGKIIWGYEVYECAVVWFMLATFIARNVLNLILKIEKEMMQLPAVLLCMGLSYLLYHIDFTYFCLPQGFMAVGYCYTGMLVKNHHILDKIKKAKWIYGILFLVTVIHPFWSGFGMAYGIFEHGIIDFIFAGCSGLLFLSLGIYVGQQDWKCLEPIKKTGIYTYWIMCIHSIEMTCIPWYHWSAVMAERQLIAFFVEACVKIVLMVSICFVLKEINKYRYRRRMIHRKA